MAVMRVNPTRMELSRLKRQLKTAVRGHKLLKDKRDEMMRQFIELIRQNQRLRREVEQTLQQCLQGFLFAGAVMSQEAMETALVFPARTLSLEVGHRNVMNVETPALSLQSSPAGQMPYGFAATSGELDGAVMALSTLLPKMIELAQIEKTCNLLADEIEKTRRRVNALEYVMIPQFEETIHSIAMKLDENERGSLTRLMKVKAMLAERNQA